MPESKKRKPKRNRQRLAARDGERIKVPGCCPDLEVELGVGRLNIRHTDDCAALDPASPAYVPARVQANAAAAKAMSARGIGPTVVMLGGRR